MTNPELLLKIYVHLGVKLQVAQCMKWVIGCCWMYAVSSRDILIVWATRNVSTTNGSPNISSSFENLFFFFKNECEYNG